MSVMHIHDTIDTTYIVELCEQCPLVTRFALNTVDV